MPQIFKPATNYLARASLIGGLLAPLVLGYAIAALSRSPANTKVQVPLNQPIPFSHQHHAWELGIDCRYCHTTVEKSPYAGLPPTETCMSCHSQIWTNSPLLEPIRQSYETGTPIKWNLVNKTPEFVYFNHSIHISRGINCNTCHGPVQNMHITFKGNSFQMAWCLQCHRAPERYLYQDEAHPEVTGRSQVFNLYWKYQAGEELSPRERQILEGEDQGTDNAEMKEKGRALLDKYGVKVQQLADCAVCHH
ncbi:MAG: hypothetical protein BGO01_19925 [Armatimonadetes bacterium 55-13]|nr:cytochrome c3 family protein [Armatimonadota bacterium]OJU64382.1 MAG: hypothetical protein BGO01_19925 [Armatimonadetes bacterium 55-13]